MFHYTRAKLTPWLMMGLSGRTVSWLRLGFAIVGLAMRGLR